MICPHCLYKKTEVYNSRQTNKGASVWRRRRCLSCRKAFSTQEYADFTGLWKIKTSNKTASYSRAQLAVSLLRACDHLEQSDDKVFYLLGSIEQGLIPIAAKNNLILSAADITRVTSAILKRYDMAAHIKYISYRRISKSQQ